MLLKTKCNPGNRKIAAAGSDGRTKSKKADGECHYWGRKDHWMRNCPELAAELKNRKASRKGHEKGQSSINMIDNFGSSDSDDDESSILSYRKILKDFPIPISSRIDYELPSSFGTLLFCPTCCEGKQTREKIPTKEQRRSSCIVCRVIQRENQSANGVDRTTKPLELVHTDLAAFYPPPLHLDQGTC